MSNLALYSETRSVGQSCKVAPLKSGLARVCGIGLLTTALSGCQNITNGMPVSQVRIIDVSPDAPAVDIYQSGSAQGGAAIAYNLGFGTVTSYVAIAPGVSTVHADAAGSRQQIGVSRGLFAASGQYTVLIGNVAANLSQTVLVDQNASAPAGQISIRVLNQVTHLGGGIDVYLVPSGLTLQSVSPLLTNFTFGANGGYINVPAGTYTLALLPAGTVPVAATIPMYTGAKVTYAPGTARTLILLDQQVESEVAFQVTTAVDYDPPS